MIYPGQLKDSYNAVTVLKGLSGFAYSDVGGLNITAAQANAFDLYVVVQVFRTHSHLSY